jgi:hypothetical protein
MQNFEVVGADFQAASSLDNGAAAGTGVTASEFLGRVHRTIIQLSAVRMALTDTGGANGAYSSLKVYDFPAGNILVQGVVSSLASVARVGTNLSATATVKHSLGSAAEATNDTLDGTQANFLPSTDIVLAAGVGAGGGESTAQTILNGTAAAVDAILNVGVADAGIAGADSVDISGTIIITWINLGDN